MNCSVTCLNTIPQHQILHTLQHRDHQSATRPRLHPVQPAGRHRLTAQPFELLGERALTVGGSALLLLLVWLMYRLAMPILIERMSAGDALLVRRSDVQSGSPRCDPWLTLLNTKAQMSGLWCG